MQKLLNKISTKVVGENLFCHRFLGGSSSNIVCDGNSQEYIRKFM